MIVRVFLLAVLSLSAVAAIAATEAAEVHVALKPLAVLAHRHYTLGDIADIDSRDPDRVKTIAAIPLGNGPRPGYTDRMSKEELQRLVRGRGVDADLIWSGAEAVRVETVGHLFDAQEIVADAERHLRELLSAASERVELRPAGNVESLRLPSGKVTLRPRPMTLPQALRKRTSVWVDVFLDGVYYRSVVVPFLVEAYRPVLVTRRDLAKGQAPTCADVEQRMQDVAAFDAEPGPSECHASLGRLKRAVTPGTTLLAAHLQPIPAVSQGEMVTLQAGLRSLLLEVQAVALADAAVGQQVTVKTNTANEPVIAQVVAPGIVKAAGR